MRPKKKEKRIYLNALSVAQGAYKFLAEFMKAHFNKH